MASRHQRKTWIASARRNIMTNDWIWGNWIRNGYRKASEIDMGYPRVQTPYGDIFCVYDTSPAIARMHQSLIIRTYERSNEARPLFVDRHVFALIQGAENGILHPHL